MAAFKEYQKYDGLGLAGLVAKKEVSPADLLDAAIEQIEKKNPRLNSVILKMYDHARKSLETQGSGPFAGVPFLLKDLLAAYAGVPMSSGSRAYKNYIPPVDSELVKRFKKTGVVILGKTNTPEFGLMAVTEPELHGPTRNPWDTDRTPGGSSGGSASAVSSGMTPIACAGDGGGSIRIPSSHCGIFGLKPSRGRNPTGPYYGEIWQGAVVEHIVSRSVRDSAAMLDATLGDDTGAPYTIQRPTKSYQSLLDGNPGKLKIGFSTKSPIGTEVHAHCKEAVADAAKLLADLGHHVEEADPAFDGQALAKSYLIMYFGEILEEIRSAGENLKRRPRKSDFEATTWMLGLLGKAFSAADFVHAMKEWHKLGRVMGTYHEKYDLFLTPTAAFPPVRIGELQPKPAEKVLMSVINFFGAGKLLKASGIVDQLAEQSLSKTPFTQLANLTGAPAMSVPLYWSSDKLPIGAHFAAAIGREDLLFSLAGQLEKARPWFDRRPEEFT